MTPEDAVAASHRLNETGYFRDKWFYYPAYHDRLNEWFVMRRLKNAEVHPAVFCDGGYGISEQICAASGI